MQRYILSLLLAIFITALVLLYVKLKKRRQLRKVQRQAIKQIGVENFTISSTIQVVKWAAMAYFPRHEIAALSGQKFVEYLASKLTQAQRANFMSSTEQHFLELYQKEHESNINLEFNKACVTWLEKALPPKKGEKS